MTGMSQSASQMAETASARATVGRACSGIPSPSMSSTTADLSLPAACPALASNSARPINPATKPMIAGEEQRDDDRDIAPGGIHVAERHDGNEAGNDKQ